MFGASMLVAPVMEQGSSHREVFLPDSERWYDACTGLEVKQSSGWLSSANKTQHKVQQLVLLTRPFAAADQSAVIASLEVTQVFDHQKTCTGRSGSYLPKNMFCMVGTLLLRLPSESGACQAMLTPLASSVFDSSTLAGGIICSSWTQLWRQAGFPVSAHARLTSGVAGQCEHGKHSSLLAWRSHCAQKRESTPQHSTDAQGSLHAVDSS